MPQSDLITNGKLVDQLLDRIEAARAKPWVPPTPKERYERDRCRCYKCKRVMKTGEAVWRQWTGKGHGPFGGWRKGIEYFCRKCSKGACAHSQGKCSFCQRVIHDCARHGWKQPRFYYCSYHCQRRGESTRQSVQVSERRAAARGPSRECPVCHEPFETTRQHARYCSGVCRQRAYRRRKEALRL